ncbi:protein kinase [Anabaena cylindrica FACHB-243]|uniref:Serine/threonine protein kinase with FHA domain n=1 Tax=Anabaena cylindrica (strain ATCC 27899 / PCC 7122) TaxID=272123 RepID=K9ZHR6_ANACC|nr:MULTISPECIES: protein kinase [Anabaena]AFZ58773.1 serine/threonine protein kinase with FHA domain [Anabaena cylindrica PCC 7122]MBD2420114.1 protein kinase [Anabaena cylindrica FACHB-243]MBY5285372.1 protein kinase [Anabaena sp. CCAP 1446/1C]MBY5306587.1 protein kinase [Anabaena sp. CCAP 1446/1C]MCM2406988.1 serine/threonine-protein kinase [Anabaena sp. CCAP 1446/1C]
MSPKVTLTITQGKFSGKQYIFESRSTCIIGRNHDCNLQLAKEIDMTISRYHCLLDINPPDIRLRDLGSLNGTFVNNEKIGQRKRNQTAQEGLTLNFPEYDLQDGDEIKLGDTLFKVGVEVEASEITKTPKILEEEVKPNYLNIVQRLLGLAASGDQNLQAISGYQLVRSLGKGRFGEVFLAQHSQARKFVALKVMLPAVNSQERGVQKFLQEVENTKCLKNSHVVQLLDYGFAEQTFFFTMEYCESGNIWDFMQKLGWRLPVNIAVDIILQVLDGLIYTHQAEIPYVESADGKLVKGKGLVHRDLNPNNILIANINDKIVAKIGDYGLAKAFDLAGLSGQTLTGSQMGTPAFIPRQQVLDFKHALPEVDVWATAACLYNMLTGYFPRDFTGDPWLAVLQNDPVPIHKRNNSIPKKLAEVIDLALVEKPKITFQTADEFKQELIKSIK